MLLIMLISAALIALDQVLKYLAMLHLAPIGSMTLIPGFIGLRYVENTGAAFNIFAGQQTLLIIITGLALLGALVYVLRFHRLKGWMEPITFICIFSGGVGNLIDRVARGFVVDYIDLLFMRFAVFNLADCLVCVGFALLVIVVMKHEIKVKREADKRKLAQEAGGEEPAPGERDGEA